MWAGCAADYRRIGRRAARISATLETEGDVRVASPGGTDLRFSLAGRPVVIGDGLATSDKAARGIVTFLPSGEAEVSVDEDSAQGTLVYDLPIRRVGAVVRGLRVRLEGGRVVSWRAQAHGSAFAEYLQRGGGADRFAFFGFGLNPDLAFGFTQDDKVLGGVTLGIGDNEGKGGRNRAGGADWWGCVSDATVTVGRRTLMKGGALRPLSS